MRNAPLVCWLIIALAATGCAAALGPLETAPKSEIAPDQIIVYVVRHAEKVVSEEQPKDPPLTARGAQRAAALAREIDVASLVAVYATPYARTKGTGAPCAEAAGVPVTEYAPDGTAELVAKIKGALKGGVLVVGHSNTVPEIVKALGVAEPVVLGEDDFGDLFVVTLATDGTTAMERRRFGD